MVNSRIRSFLCIIIVFVFVLCTRFADGNKHRNLHLQHHHHHHQHHRIPHTKTRYHSPLVKHYSQAIKGKSHFVGEIINKTKNDPDVNFSSNEKSILTNNSFPNEPKTKTSNFPSSRMTIVVNSEFFNSTPNSKENRNISTRGLIATSEISKTLNKVDDIFSRNSTSGSIFDSSNVPSNVVEIQDHTTFLSNLTTSSSTEKIVNVQRTTPNVLSTKNVFRNIISENDIFSSDSDKSFRITSESNEIKNTTYSENNDVENSSTRAVQMVNITGTESTIDTSGSQKKDTNENFTVKLITNSELKTIHFHEPSSEELQELFGSTRDEKDPINIVHPIVEMIRKKRSIPEEDDDEPKKRSLLDFDGPAISTDPEELDDDSLSNVAHKRVKRDRPLEFDDNPSFMDSKYLQDLEDSFAPSALEIQADKRQEYTAGIMPSQSLINRNSFVNKLRLKRDVEDDKYETADETAAENERDITKDEQHVEQQKYVLSDSPASITENSTLKDESTFINLTKTIDNYNDQSPSVNLSAAARNSENEEKNDGSNDDNSLREEKSVFGDSHLHDEDTVSRNKLDDIYPDVMEYDRHKSPMTPLVRTKRFGDIYPESSDFSYEKEQPDMSKMYDEPYAEDNKIIDSMLDKVDDQASGDRSRYARRNNENLYDKVDREADERSDMSVKDKRDSGFLSRERNKIDYNRMYAKKNKDRRKKKKMRKKKKKLRNRPKGPKNKRTLLLDERQLRAGDVSSDIKRGTVNNDVGDRFGEIYDPDVISPHDGRRRRDYEDESDDTLSFYPNGPALGRIRRDVRETEDAEDSSIETDEKAEVPLPVDERDRITDDEKIREKRELKYYENVREINEGPNRTSRLSETNSFDSKAVQPINDIKELVQKLLVKVNELHGYVDRSSGSGTAAKDSRDLERLTEAGLISRSTETPNVVRRMAVVAKSNSAPGNAMRRRKTRCKTLMSHRPLHHSKKRRPTKSIVGCEKKKRRKRKSHRKWGRWTDWSSCSVTCGRGRQIRWRHCLRNCSTAETEMEEKTCQYPACAPGKFLGIFG